MKKTNMHAILFLLCTLTLGACSKQANYDYDNSKPVYQKADLQTLRQAPYPIGAAVTPSTLKSNANYRNTVTTEMSSISGENAMKMNAISRGRKSYFWDDADYLVNFAVENKLRVHGHTLIWYKHTPSWVSSFSGTKEDWKTIMKEYIQDVVGRYKGKVASWDVVNEIINDDGSLRDCIWLQKIGPEYISLAFQYAHEADPAAILFYNDYGHEYSHARRKKAYHLADSLAKNNVPIHGLGLQMHTNISRAGNDIRYAITAAAVTGLKVHVSEFDVAVNADKKLTAINETVALQQKELYRVAAKAMLDIPENQRWGITMWGVHDPSSWLSPNPDWALPFNASFEKKPAYDGLLQGFYQGK